MAADLWRASPAARAVFERADAVLGYALTEVCFEGPEERLRDTYYAQPAILTASLACLAAALESGRVRQRPAFVAGHSVGEYAALIAAAALSFEDGLTLVQERACLMRAANEANPGTMAAILGADEATVAELCAEAGASVCNRNLPSQTVIGGSFAAVTRAIELAKQRGLRAIPLNVGGAFHSPLMASAVTGLREAARRAAVESPRVPVVSNVSATVLTTPDAIRDELPLQVVSPVRWHESIQLMSEAGVSQFIELGPGRVLTGLVKRLVSGSDLVNISCLADVTALSDSPVRTSA